MAVGPPHGICEMDSTAAAILLDGQLHKVIIPLGFFSLRKATQMERTRPDHAATRRLSDEMDALARVALRKSLAADHVGDAIRCEFWARHLQGYSDLAVLLDEFEAELRLNQQLRQE
jgi:hypothetical protein